MKFIIGKKLEMTQIWQGEKVIGVTKVQAGPCPIVDIKNEAKDGYAAVQLGFGERKEKNIKKPQLGHLSKVNPLAGGQKSKVNLKYLREFRDEVKNLKVGDIVDVKTFAAGDVIKVTGTSKGKGFQGGVKRHGWAGHFQTHGTKDQVRTSGSIGAGGMQHVLKGMRMPGRMGNDRVTTSNLKIAQIDETNNILYIAGSVPGARNGLVLICGVGELKITPKITKEETPADVRQAETPQDAKVAEINVETVKPAEAVKEESKQATVNSKQENAHKAEEKKEEVKK